MRSNRFTTSKSFAGLALAPVALTLVLAKDVTRVSPSPAEPQNNAKLADFGSVGERAIAPVRFATSTIFIAELPAPLPDTLNLAAGKTPPPVAFTVKGAASLPSPAAPASEIAAHKPMAMPLPALTVPVQIEAVQTEPAGLLVAPIAASPQPVLSEQADFRTTVPVAIAAYPPEAGDRALLAANPAEAIPAPVPDLPGSSSGEQSSSLAQTPPQSVPTIQPAPVQAVIIADWNYTIPSEVRASEIQSFVGQADADAAPAKPADAPSRALRNARAPHHASAQLAPAQKGPATGAKGARRGPGIAAALELHGKYRMAGNAIEFQLPVEVNGEQLGNVTLHVLPDQQIALQLKELVTLFAPQLDRQLLEALSRTQTAEQYVSFDRLREAGIDIRYDGARDQIRLKVAQP